MPEFKRRWRWFGKLVSEDGASIWYGNRTVHYRDDRGTFSFGFEDGFLFPEPFQPKEERILLTQSEVEEMVERVVAGIRSDGHAVLIFKEDRSVEQPVDDSDENRLFPR